MRKFLALLFALLLCTATKVYAEDTATVTVTVKDLPQKLQNRTVIVTLGNGPSDTESTVIVLDGLNNYTETVTVVPSEYYCAAAVQYDALGDYPLQEINQTTFLQAEGGNHYDLIYTLADSSWYESVTGQQRHYTLQPLETPPENYEPKPAQVGAYLTAPVGFSQHVIVYLQNLYTDDVYDLELYESNGLAAVEPNALSGKYAFLSAYVVGDAENRYQFNCEQNELSTENGVDFHLTVTDTANPDREMNTPSRDQNSTVQAANSFNNRNTDAPQQPTAELEIASQPVKQQEKQLDLLIVVDQMLTGFDSKWINTLYLDKMLQYENLIQAFSRTNRLFGDDKQFGTIKYYRRPHTMEKNIADAVKEYSGDKPFGLFVDKLDKNVEKLNALYVEIKDLFVSAGIEEFSQIPADMAERKKFADLFQSFNENLEAAKVQGFEWDKPIVIINEDTDEKTELHADFDERTFKVLALRYKELFTPNPDGGENDPDDDVPYAVNSYLTTIDTADIDTDYMNSRFEKYLKIFYQEGAEAEAIHQAETELHKTFATLSQEEQKYANIFLHDIQSGAVVPQPGKTLREYIAEYIAQKQNDQIHKVAEVFGLDEKKLRAFMRANITEANINEFGRFDDLKATVDKPKAKAYFEAIEGTKLIPPKVPVKYDKLLREFIVSGGFDLKMPKES